GPGSARKQQRATNGNRKSQGFTPIFSPKRRRFQDFVEGFGGISEVAQLADSQVGDVHFDKANESRGVARRAVCENGSGLLQACRRRPTLPRRCTCSTRAQCTSSSSVAWRRF